MKVWITKYALTGGVISEADTESNSDCFLPSELHPTKEAAIAHAEKMRRDKLRSLQNQIDKLNNLKFT